MTLQNTLRINYLQYFAQPIYFGDLLLRQGRSFYGHVSGFVGRMSGQSRARRFLVGRIAVRLVVAWLLLDEGRLVK